LDCHCAGRPFFMENATPHQQHWVNSIQEALSNHFFMIGWWSPDSLCGVNRCFAQNTEGQTKAFQLSLQFLSRWYDDDDTWFLVPFTDEGSWKLPKRLRTLSSSLVKFTSQWGSYKTKRFGSCTTTIFSGEVQLLRWLYNYRNIWFCNSLIG